jgi:hypothetical protein
LKPMVTWGSPMTWETPIPRGQAGHGYLPCDEALPVKRASRSQMAMAMSQNHHPVYPKIAGWGKFILGNLVTYIIYRYIYIYICIIYNRFWSNEYCNCGVYWYTLNTQFRCWGSADVVYGGCGLAGVIIIKMCCARGQGVKSVDRPDAGASQEQPIEERGSCFFAALEAGRRLFWQSCLGHNIFMFNSIAHRAIGINPVMMEFMYSWS